MYDRVANFVDEILNCNSINVFMFTFKQNQNQRKTRLNFWFTYKGRIFIVICTFTAAIQLKSHRNMTMPSSGIEFYKASTDWCPEATDNHYLPLRVSLEDLFKNKSKVIKLRTITCPGP